MKKILLFLSVLIFCSVIINAEDDQTQQGYYDGYGHWQPGIEPTHDYSNLTSEDLGGPQISDQKQAAFEKNIQTKVEEALAKILFADTRTSVTVTSDIDFNIKGDMTINKISVSVIANKLPEDITSIRNAVIAASGIDLARGDEVNIESDAASKFTFQGVKWDMLETEVKKIIGDKSVNKVKGLILPVQKKDVIAGIPCSIDFMFNKNKLNNILVSFESKRVAIDFETLKTSLIAKYGEPLNQSYDYLVSWKTLGTDIMLMGSTAKKYLNISYSRALTEAEKKEDAEKEQKAIKANAEKL